MALNDLHHLVWAQARKLIRLNRSYLAHADALIASYPWWAAVVFEPDDPEVPSLVLESKKLPAARRATHLVRFYDNGKTWFVNLANLTRSVSILPFILGNGYLRTNSDYWEKTKVIIITEYRRQN